MKKSIRKLILSAAIIIAVVLCTLFAKNNPEFISKYYAPVSKWLSGVMSAFWSVIPLSAAELMIAAAVIFSITLIVFIIKRKISFLSFLSTVILTISIVVGFSQLAWGLNYYAEPLADSLGIPVSRYTEEELMDAAEYYIQKANEYALFSERDEAGNIYSGSFSEINQKTITAYENLSKEYPFFKGQYYPAKGFLTSGIFIRFDITGMYTPYSGEANVVLKTAPLSMPFTVAHEFAHRLAIAPEDEANFAAFLACTYSKDINFLYSGYYMAFVYCYNALPSGLRAELWNELNPTLKADIEAVSEYYKQYESKASEIGNKVNDTYLKAMNQQSGIKSYGEVVDLLIAYYQQNAGE